MDKHKKYKISGVYRLIWNEQLQREEKVWLQTDFRDFKPCQIISYDAQPDIQDCQFN